MSLTRTRPLSPAPEALDAAGLQALAADALADENAADGRRARRGPFRPDVWLNARQRHASRLAAHYFHTADIMTVLLLTFACLVVVAPDGLLAAPLGLLAPYAAGAAALIALLRSSGVYGFNRDRRLAVHLAIVSSATAVSGGMALLLAWLAGTSAPGVTGVMVWTGLCLAALYVQHVIWWRLVRRWRTNGALTPNIVVVGATRHAEALIREALQRRDLNVLGVFDDRLARSPDSIEGVPVLGDISALISHRMTPYVDRIVLAVDPAARQRIGELTRRLQSLPNEITLLVDPKGADERNEALEKLARAPLASLGAGDPDRAAFHKRMQDLVLGGVALVLLSPLLALIALAIRLDSPGPALFRQRRHGFNNEEIVVWKFRTMRNDAADATAARQVTYDDDRVTRVGKILRPTSLDELPQLINVIRGEMSLVGPRPHAIGMKTGEVESARLVAEYAHRHRIKPGMTGWAAIKGSRGPLHTAAEVRQRVKLDIEYVERQSLWLDLWIMAVTIPVLLGDKAAVR